jgi:hypothetical protein
MAVLKNIQAYIPSTADKEDVMSDIRYICKSCSLITESLQKGCDVMQLPDGTIVVTELKAVTFQYAWDSKKGKLVRVQAGGRTKKVKEVSKERSKRKLESVE